MTKLIALVLLAASHSAAFAGDRVLLAGRQWVDLSPAVKVAWLAGYTEAAAMWEAEATQNHETTSLSHSFPLTLSVKEIVESLDLFYADYANRGIKVFLALDWMHARMTGASAEVLQKQLEALRRSASEVDGK